MRTLMKHVLFLTVLMVMASTANAAIDPAKVQKLLASDGSDLDYFGGSIAMSGDTAVIGASSDDDKGTDSGSAYVFVRAANGTWSQQAKLTAADGAAEDYFGSSVAVSGDTAVIGAFSDDDKGTNSGSAYVFVRAANGTWSQQAKLTAADGASGNYFGGSVAMSGDTAVIGANWDDNKGEGSGSAYVFVRADGTWSQQAKLNADDGAAFDWFGGSVAMSGDTAVIGAFGDDDKGEVSGSAYVFAREANGTWSQQAKLNAADGAATGKFGTSVAVDGDTVVIGADKYNDGSAYIFVRADGTWSQQSKLTADDGAHGKEFGGSVAVSRNTAIIGALDESYIGSAYVFVRAAGGTWSQQDKLTAADGGIYDSFGCSVAVSGDTAVIGASENESAYVFGKASGHVNMAPIYKLLLLR